MNAERLAAFLFGHRLGHHIGVSSGHDPHHRKANGQEQRRRREHGKHDEGLVAAGGDHARHQGPEAQAAMDEQGDDDEGTEAAGNRAETGSRRVLLPP